MIKISTKFVVHTAVRCV